MAERETSIPPSPPSSEEFSVNILVIDVGGTHVNILVSGQETPRKFDSGPTMGPGPMVAGVVQAAEGWRYDAVSIG